MRGVEKPEGVIVQFGGQTPLKLAAGLEAAGVPLLGTSVDAIDLAEDRGRFGALLGRVGLQAPPYATACSVAEALECGDEVGYPLFVRPSFVLEGHAMEIVSRQWADGLPRPARTMAGTRTNGRTPPQIGTLLARARQPSGLPATRPAAARRAAPKRRRLLSQRRDLLDRFLENAVGLIVLTCALRRGTTFRSAGSSGTSRRPACHSGDSRLRAAAHSLGGEILDRIRAGRARSRSRSAWSVAGVRVAVHAQRLYVIRPTRAPRARCPSSTRPSGCRWRSSPVASCWASRSPRSDSRGSAKGSAWRHVSVRRACSPSIASMAPTRCSAPDPLHRRGDGHPRATSHGDLPGPRAAAGVPLPHAGTAFVTVTDSDKAGAFAIAQILHERGLADSHTRHPLRRSRASASRRAPRQNRRGLPARRRFDRARNVDLVVNTAARLGTHTDGWEFRRAAVARGVPYLRARLHGGLRRAGDAACRHGRARGCGAAPVLVLQELHGHRDRASRTLQRRTGGVSPQTLRRPARARASGPRGSLATVLAPTRQAPFGRHLLEVAGIGQLRADRVCGLADPHRSAPQPGAFRDARRRRALGGGGGRASLPAPRLLDRTPGARGEAPTLP